MARARTLCALILRGLPVRDISLGAFTDFLLSTHLWTREEIVSALQQLTNNHYSETPCSDLSVGQSLVRRLLSRWNSERWYVPQILTVYIPIYRLVTCFECSQVGIVDANGKHYCKTDGRVQPGIPINFKDKVSSQVRNASLARLMVDADPMHHSLRLSDY
jgi:hypothetical protein